MTEEDKNKEEEPIEENSTSPAHYLRVLFRYAMGLLSIRTGVVYEDAVETIKKDIDFKGPKIWILISSIFIAAIGLNVNSAPVIIGAMLISPLMGPILGIGLAVGTNDWTLLKRALRNFAIMTVVSVITSFIYFYFTPLRAVQSELLARVSPTSLDVAIAFFGGVAGIIVGTRTEKGSVIPGVAIATALMPPLCTAGFGLATGNWVYFLGAFYLFFINSVFIALSTFIVVRYLKFPIVHYVDPIKERRYRIYTYGFIILLVLPSGWLFYNTVQETGYEGRANDFIEKVISYPGTEINNKVVIYNDTLPIIKVFLDGEKSVPKEVIEQWKRELPIYGLASVDFRVIQSGVDIDQYKRELEELEMDVKQGILKDVYERNQNLLESKEEQIVYLEEELVKLRSRRTVYDIPFTAVEQEMKVQYPELKRFSYAMSLESDFLEEQPDTICTFLVQWQEDVKDEEREKLEDKLSRWLSLRLERDTVRILNY